MSTEEYINSIKCENNRLRADIERLIKAYTDNEREIVGLGDRIYKIMKERDTLTIERDALKEEVGRLLPVAEQMAAEDCETYCGDTCDADPGEDGFDPEVTCWPTRARALINGGE
ncbi:hypothetical protein LCGC14_1471940 [marine sediment metagenome]|uniref:Uncharacterized protein n=1 Tax=marine sediment metagenome TaxID=412755 RepID=A0A0F9MDV9_9ZZZZ